MANEEQQQSWATQGVDWVDHAAIFEAALAPFADAVLQAADIGSDARVLDIGCGSGTLLQRAAGIGAVPVGVDISQPMVVAARRRVPEATVVLGDAQIMDLGGPVFDRVISRFGVMFFDDPVAAFINIRRAAAPGARLAFVCWREGDNPMFSVGVDMLAAQLESPPAAADPTEPGPLAFGNAERVRTILADAGWADVELAAFDGVCNFSIDGSDGVEERLTMILSNRTGQQARTELPARLGEDGWAAVVDKLRDELRRHRVDGVLKFPGHTWVVTATNPG
ncbi:class I SAM-dependent methyltransferase [Mycolicibacter kumamotonensis]|uniref:Methyltransferase domain-containing protein n=1 Tax=Mycolicibacter kumamotonensis TaxID=354243 RepID=A0A1B8SGI0_9MYCO|nr:class I SAM-dependent methyltransferase [Mycolicibacter kumamotonensis]NDJ91934.1 methyltransferase domain-containing protein [Mycolicibacter kumamotonensis]OBY31851.1 methyltransferase type 11 [Mycolicibacter kumamotonensis]